jgi:predicted ATP-dependent serine protease
MTTEIKYYCQNCKQKLSGGDKVCPSCGGIQKHIEVFIEAETGLYGKLSTELTESEQKTLVRVSKFFQEELRRWSFGSVSVSLNFPSGVSITLHWKRDKESK